MERSLFITSLLASSLCVRPGGIDLSELGSGFHLRPRAAQHPRTDGTMIRPPP